MFGFFCILVGFCFYGAIFALIFSISPPLFWIIGTLCLIRSFLTAGPLTNKARHAARRRENRLQMLLSEID